MAPDQDDDFSYEIEFVAVAAAAYAIHSVEEAELEHENKLRDDSRASMSRVETRRDEPSDQDDHDFSYEIEFVGVAAAVFAINSVVEAELMEENKLRDEDSRSASMSSVETRRDEPSGIPEAGQIPGKEAEGESAIWKEPARQAGLDLLEGPRRRISDAETEEHWEKSAMAKLLKRHEKVNSSIIAWEREKKMKAKAEMEKKTRELEQKKAINLQLYRNEIARIEHIARGARVQLEDKRRKEESEVKKRAKKRIRSKGKVPFGRCFCL